MRTKPRNNIPLMSKKMPLLKFTIHKFRDCFLCIVHMLTKSIILNLNYCHHITPYLVRYLPISLTLQPKKFMKKQSQFCI